MPAGLRTWDAQGNLVIDLSTRMGTILGTTMTGTSNGSILVPAFGLPNAVPFWTVMGSSGHGMYAPQIQAGYIDGAWRLKWTFRDPLGNSDYRITYGVY